MRYLVMTAFFISVTLAGVVNPLPVRSAHFRARASLQERPLLELKPSAIEEEMEHFVESHPGISAEEVTARANSLLEKKGFDYHFEISGFIETLKLQPVDPSEESVYRFPLNLVKGGRLSLQCSLSFGPCGEFFAGIPSLKVTSSGILSVLDRKRYLFKRPADFRLDDMKLVDATKRKVMRKWEVPLQTYPIGISLDGQTLYLPVRFGGDDDDAIRQLLWEKDRKGFPFSVLAISATGIRFEVAAKMLAGQESEEIEDAPKDPENAYLAFRRFRIGRKTYIVRYSQPCT